MRKKTTSMVHRIPITKARINLGQLVRRVHLNKEYFILEKGGIPVAGIMDAEELEDYLELQDPEVQRQIEKSNEDIRAGRTRPAEELLAELGKVRRKKTVAPRRQKA
ncbi:type II toxin-antitoxin system Phd/YefM family antitoxin [Acidobacteria bacterium AH-259-G07]|nr:type II toxin-antitoxin system Phd/YefM family antitoxin [Acidobacteria bacterium AH-259-G07]